MFKSIICCALLVFMVYLVYGAPPDPQIKLTDEQTAIIKKVRGAEVLCKNKTGVQKPGAMETWTENEKCFAACVLEEFGAMNADGSYVESFVDKWLQHDDLLGFVVDDKDKAKQTWSECTRSAVGETNKCEKAFKLHKCLHEKHQAEKAKKQ